jgi:hypothetical protein
MKTLSIRQPNAEQILRGKMKTGISEQAHSASSKQLAIVEVSMLR